MGDIPFEIDCIGRPRSEVENGIFPDSRNCNNRFYCMTSASL